MEVENINADNISLDKQSYENILVYNFYTKN